MLIIAEQKVFRIGRYTVRQQIRPDNPYWPQYVIFLGDDLVGKQFSMPNESDCDWLRRTNGVYALVSAPTTKFSVSRRRGRPSNVERASRQALESAAA